MTQPAKAQEPSMEEILASIRRIISDDDTAAKAAAAPPKAATPPAPPPRAEAPSRPAPVPPQPKPVSAVPRTPAAIENDIAAVLAEPEKPFVESAPKTTGNGAADLADPDILELTEEMAAEPPAPERDMRASNFRTIDGQPDVFFAETPEQEQEPEPEDEPVFAMPSEPSPPPPSSLGYDSLHSSAIISQATSAAVDSAFNQLAQSVFTQNGRTIEDLVRDMLRPMLKSWLDDNLPGLVERLVRAEIERVSRGR
jgi:cell pole-organizing protein PopZ